MKSGSSTGVVALTAGAAFIAGLDNLVVTFALPAIQRDFGLEVSALSWIVNAYTFTFAVFMLAAAAVGERIGRRTAFQVGVGIFTAASIMVALSPGVEVLVIARAVQGVGAAILVPLSLTLLVQETVEERRPVVIAVWSAAQGLATAIGPLIGGAIVQFVGWQWGFWINVPIGLLLMFAAPRMVRDLTTSTGAFDLVGLIGLSTAVLALVIALTAGGPALAIGVGAVAVVSFVWFLGHIRRSRHPIIDPGLLSSRGFTLTNLTALLVTAGMFGVVFLLTQYLQRVRGYEPLQAGLLTLPWTLLPVLAAPIAGQLVPRFGTGRILTFGALLQAASLVSFALVLRPDVPYLLLLPGLLLAGLGMGAFFAVLATQALRFVPAKDEGIASGINNFVRELGVLIGVAMLTAVFIITGDQSDAAQFTRGLVASLWVGAAVLTLAVVSSLSTPKPEDSPAA
ncbi:MAG: MFS transporter [Arachnia propionica]|uniref:MFS transporter n=1 Tax=Arachnia propionica TaxID=1750 RepID=UPI0027030A57|nr:MFS transporter [Arachnia propionica]